MMRQPKKQDNRNSFISMFLSIPFIPITYIILLMISITGMMVDEMSKWMIALTAGSEINKTRIKYESHPIYQAYFVIRQIAQPLATLPLTIVIPNILITTSTRCTYA